MTMTARTAYAPCPVCGSMNDRAGFCCDGCHKQYMQQLEARWAQSFATGRSCDDGTPPPMQESKASRRETLVAEIMTHLRLWRLAFWHPGKSMFCGDHMPPIEAPRTSRVVHRRKWMSE